MQLEPVTSVTAMAAPPKASVGVSWPTDSQAGWWNASSFDPIGSDLRGNRRLNEREQREMITWT
jgi:hypothetical protein